AASSRVRLEMLLEPGRTTVPDTARTGERSRCGVRPAMQLLSISGWKARSHPGLAQDAGVGEARFQRLGVPALQQRPKFGHGTLESFQFGQQRFAIGHADIAPHARMTGCETGEIVEACTRMGQG